MPSPENNTLRWVLLAKAGAGVALVFALIGGWWLRAHGGGLELANEVGKTHEPRFQWRSVDRRHWQALGRVGDREAPLGEAPEATDAREANTAGCTTGMVRVKGNYRLDSGGETSGEIERIQDGACTDWISKDFPARCRTFDADRIATETAKLKTRPLDFCMDRFEYPNVLGQNPVIVVTFHEAEAMCKKDQKRLCNESEWTFACEGEDAEPYPYGYTRDATACVVDRDWRPFAEGALQPRDGTVARAEVDRLWQAEPSGSRAACRSPFGVYDMTGNVDEWTRSVRPKGYASILKGGYWGPVRARCRPATRAHNEDFVAYQQGFRCCADSNASQPAPRATPAVAGGAATGKTPAALAPRADAGAATVADLAPEWGSGTADGDEAEAIGRARVGSACAVASGAIAPSSLSLASPAALAVGFLALLGLVLRERGGRERRSPAGGVSPSAAVIGAACGPRSVRRSG